MSLMGPHGTFRDLIKKCPAMEHSLMALMMSVSPNIIPHPLQPALN
jgi:hypothetical protein